MSLIGKPLPSFSLQDDQGRTLSNTELLGTWTILYAYPKDSTPGCTQEACDFRDSWTRVQALGVQVFGISRDSLKSHQNFISKQSLPFRLLSDPETALLKPLGAFGKKIMYGKECEGIIRSTFLIDPKGLIQAVWPKVSVKGHVAEVLAKLEALRG